MKRLLALLSAVLLLTAFVVTPAFAGEEKAADTAAKIEKVAPVAKDTTAAKLGRVSKDAAPKVEAPKIITTPSGLRYEDIKVGTGKVAVDSMKVQCHYTLWFADSTGLVKGELVQSSKTGGKPLDCRLDVGLITGWSEGTKGMKEGGIRTLYVPWNLGYGANGNGRGIPGKTNLIFEIEFVKAL
jgi:FKBP-type peptidyl-prolyl cis-trans isomerase FkpA